MLSFYKHLLKMTGSVAACSAMLWVAVPVMAASQQLAEASVQEASLQENTTKQRRRPRRPRPRPPRSLPPNQVQPGGGLDASTRACESSTEALTALVPVENPVYTTFAHPTFLFYFPDSPESIEYAEFIVLSADEKEQIYAAQFVPNEKGIVSISLPENSSAGLAVGQPYHWYLNMHCQTTTGVPSVNGWVQRVASEDTVGFARNNNLSALPEIWYDAIAQTAASIRLSQSTESGSVGIVNSNLQAQWSAWLMAIGLGELVDQPIIGPVNSQEVTASRY